MSTVEANKQVVRDFTRIFKNEHNVDGIDHLFAPNFEHHFTAPVSPGLRGLKEIGRIMNTAFPDVVVTELDLIATEDTVVERSSAQASNSGPYLDRPPTGTRCQWSEIHIYRFRDGKIAAHCPEVGMLELMTQIGAVRPA